MSGPVLAAIAIGASVVSAKAQLDAGKAAQDQYNAQAQQAEIQGRVQALEYKKQGVTALQNLEKVLAANIARGAAGNLDPLSSGSSSDLIARLNMRDGVNEFTIARDNASIATKMAKYQAANFRVAGKSARQTSRLNALATLGMGVASAGQLYPTAGFTGGQTTTPTTTTTPAPAPAPSGQARVSQQQYYSGTFYGN